MNNESGQRSRLLNSPIDPVVARVLRLLDPIARTAGCQYFLLGATARDIILVNIHGLRPGRATRDIDFGIAVENWAQFESLKVALVSHTEFSATHAQQRVMYEDPTDGISVPVDLVPFRGVTSADWTIAWPPRQESVMNVAGFEEAMRSSVVIEIEADLSVHVASAAGLALLKLFAWSDRGTQNNKDAADLYRILTNYADAGNIDRLYEDALNLLETANFDVQLAGAELLGRDVATLCGEQAAIQARSILALERNRDRLVLDMVRTSAYAEAVPFIERLLAAFWRGLLHARL
jgi:predicted nucleotidyltransferase